MKIRTRLFLFFLVFVGVGFHQFVSVILKDLRPRALATMEESMVETATLLASSVSSQVTEDTLPIDDLASTMELARHWNVTARIYEMDKTRMNLRVYVTDDKGIVVYDSDNTAVGEDYSKWNDVYLTLRGQYGARATRKDPDDQTSSILHVAAPIMKGDDILGVLTLAKPAASVEPFHQTAKEGIIRYGIVVAVLVIVLGMVVSVWITWPIELLTTYANQIRDGKKPRPPKMGSSEMGQLATSFEEMRDALEGKKYVEEYIETLTHEMKSPLSAIRGAAELLNEDMSQDQRDRFLANILNESARIQTLIDRLLELSSLENKKEVRVESVDLSGLLQQILDALRPQLERQQITITTQITPGLTVTGERFLLEQAISNLLQNAVNFTPEGKTITVSLDQEEEQVAFQVHNQGASIPAYALSQLFNRFYSLPHPGTGRRSSGIGLTLVKEIADLHQGTITLKNENEGVTATLSIPV